MRIRDAELSDAQDIKSIAEKNNKLEGEYDGRGFYMLPGIDSNRYEEIIEEGNIVLVAEENKEVVGYIIGYTDKSLKEFSVDTLMIDYLSRKQKPFICIEQMAIKKEHQRKGIGRKLLKEFFSHGENLGIETFWADVIHEPKKNISSASLITSLGFQLVEEIRADGMFSLGVYKKETYEN